MRRRATRICSEKAERLVECFVAGLPARHAAQAAGVNRNTAQLHYLHLREAIAKRLDLGTVAPAGSAAGGKDPALLELAPGVQHVEPLFGVIERDGGIRFVRLGGTRPTPTRIDALVCEYELAGHSGAAGRRRLQMALLAHLAQDQRRRRIVKSAWTRTMRQLSRFNGVSREHLYLYLKECEWRLGAAGADQLLPDLRAWLAEES